MDALLRRQLTAVNWDFPARQPGLSSTLHWYPGSFPSETPATLIEALTEVGEVVFDPFGGIGTTATEAIRLGRSAWIAESNPVGSAAAYVSAGLMLLWREDRRLVGELLGALVNCLGLDSGERQVRLHLRSPIIAEVDAIVAARMRPAAEEMVATIVNGAPHVLGLSPWYEKSVLNEIICLTDRLFQCSSRFMQLVGMVGLSDRLRACSSQTRSWGHLADNVFPTEFVPKSCSRAMLMWLRRTNKMLASVVPTRVRKADRQSFWLSHHDWRNGNAPTLVPRRDVALLLTSPPYAGAIDYVRAQKLSLYLWGYTEEAVGDLAAAEIGARRKRFRPGSSEEWEKETILAFQAQTHLCSRSSKMAIVLPCDDETRDEGVVRIGKAIRKLGWVREFSAQRSIRQQRARQSWSSIKRESVSVFARE